jgi:CubicO group peptidase (beta-lactamase class C family)
MTEYTLFYGGSTTKSFTAAAMSQLVDDNTHFPHVQWDTPVSSLLPDDFVLSDDWATKHMTIEDALSHRTGYPAHDFVSWADPQAATRGFRNLPMSAEPRTKFQYNNQMYTAIGYLIEKLSGGRWLGDIFRERLWKPMGMLYTFLSLDEARKSYAVLSSEFWYHNDSRSYLTIPHEPHRGHEGAGMVISNVYDYSQYLFYMMLNIRSPISNAGKAALKAPHMPIAASHPQYTGPYYYGFGWVGGVFEGEQFWFHDGQMREHMTQMWMFPRRGFGVVIMSNANTPAINTILWKIIYDQFGVDQSRRLDIEGRYVLCSAILNQFVRAILTSTIAQGMPHAPERRHCKPALPDCIGIHQQAQLPAS